MAVHWSAVQRAIVVSIVAGILAACQSLGGAQPTPTLNTPTPPPTATLTPTPEPSATPTATTPPTETPLPPQIIGPESISGERRSANGPHC